MSAPKRKEERTWARWKMFLCILLVLLIGIVVTNQLATRPTNLSDDYIDNIYYPENYDIRGIDISHYQGRIDWHRLKRAHVMGAPLSFVILKATEGADNSDEYFQRNFMNARRNNIIRGAYHFFRPNVDVQRQANFYIQTAALEPGDLPPILDVETNGGLSNDELRRRVKRWLEIIEREYGVKPILYTGLSFKRTYLNAPEFDEYPLWIAHYNVDSLSYDKQWIMWQYTDQGHIAGITGRVDCNLFNGTRQDLRNLTIP